MDEFLRSTDVIDWGDSNIRAVAGSLVVDGDSIKTACHCFHWVRDEISHSFDIQAECVSCTASQTLRNRTGICYAKSHLLAAILRANSIPAGFGYQRLSTDDAGTSFCLHGFNFVYLNELGWHAIDPRGNRDGVSTEFDPPDVSLAFSTQLPGEKTFSTIFFDPLECVVKSLQVNKTVDSLRTSLPDWDA